MSSQFLLGLGGDNGPNKHSVRWEVPVWEIEDEEGRGFSQSGGFSSSEEREGARKREMMIRYSCQPKRKHHS